MALVCVRTINSSYHGVLLYFGKTFGMSSNLRTMCSAIGADKFADFFKFNWKAQKWNLTVVLGAIIGGFIAVNFLSNDAVTALNPKTITELQTMGFKNAGTTLVPNEMYNLEALMSIKGLLLFNCWRITCWIWHQICWRLYLWSCHYRAK